MWASLHQHSQFSILDAACSVEDIAIRAAEYGMPAVALTDHGNMYGSVDFYKACKQAGVKPIIGCEVYIAPESRFEKKKTSSQSRVAYHLTLLAKSNEGYHNLCRLSSLGFLEGFYYYPRIDKELLKAHSSGLICLSGCLSSQLSAAVLYGSQEQLIAEVNWHHEVFKDNYYFELQRHEMDEAQVERFAETWLVQHYQEFIEKQKKVNSRLIELSKQFSIPYVATNDTHYMDPEDWQAHEILLNIQSGEPVEIWETNRQGVPQFRVPNPKRRIYASREMYFKTPAQMAKRFEDLPSAINTSLEIASKCNVKIDFETKHYPIYFPPELEIGCSREKQQIAASQFLKQLCEEGIVAKYTQERLAKVAEKYPGQDPLDVVRQRLNLELDLILSKGMCDYLLIVWDFINWAKKQGIPVGPGRGSGAGSIILYLIGVTEIEPLRFHLFFERFINPERISYPDIDVDICMDRRQEVIDYTMRTYGKENVAQIITFGTMKAKMTIKDVGRVLSVPLSKVNLIAKLVPEDPQMTLSKALEIDPDLNAFYTSDSDAKQIIDIGKKIEGSIRNTGIHAAGLIICGEPLTDHIPICLAKDSEMAATQYSMKPVEAVGMLKIDFLGLKTLTSIKISVDAIAKTKGEMIDWVNLPLDNGPTFSLLQEGHTLGVFQMESGGMQELGRQLKPDKFEEIIAIGALYRPGPMDMIPSFVNRKHKREPIEYDHPWMESILAETYGIMVYQEQVMQIATQLARYSLGEGDILRKAMGKKDAVQMAKEREKFRKGALENGISEETSMAIFDKMEKFASYGFNKSHAAAYGYLTYVTAYLKANYPKEWMAALLTCDRDDVSKVSKFIRECQSMGISILPPDVNEAGKEFVATAEGIRFAMTGVKGVGEGIVDAILEERRLNGPFTGFYEFFKRIDLKKVGKKPIELLVDAGSFDFTGWTRDQLKMSIEQIYDLTVKEQKEANAGVLTFFSLMKSDQKMQFSDPPTVLKPSSQYEILKKEKELLGFFLTGHPMDAYKPILNRLSCVSLCKLEEFDHNTVVRAAFIVEQADIKLASKTQKKFAILRISDGMEAYELPIWPDLYEEKMQLLEENQLLYAVLQVDKREDSLKLSCKWIGDLTQVNDAMIEACDKAFDRAKQLSNRQYTKMSTERPTAPKTIHPFLIELEIGKTKLSHILKIKEILIQSPGKQPVKIVFSSQGKQLALLSIDQALSVTASPQLETQLKSLPGFLR